MLKEWLIVFFSTLFFAQVQAQEQDTLKHYDAKPIIVTAERLPRVVEINQIATKMPLSLYQVPFSVAVLAQQVLKDQGVKVLSDALKNVSSINVQSCPGLQDYFLIRGFESTSGGLVLLDGAMEPDVSLLRFYGFGFHDLYNIDQVEVLKGPASFLYGGNTLSGVVNLARKQPQFRNATSVNFARGTFDSYRATLDANLVNAGSGLAFRLNGLLNETGSHRPHSHSQGYAINPALTVNFTPRNTITINGEVCHREIHPDDGIPLYYWNKVWITPAVPRSSSYQTSFDAMTYDITRARVDYLHDAGKSFSLRTRLFFSHLTGTARLTLLHLPRAVAEGRIWLVDRHLYTLDEEQELIGNQLDAIFKFQTGAVEHNLVVGLEVLHLGYKSVRGTTVLESLDLFAPVDSVADFNQLRTYVVKVPTNADNLVMAPYVVDRVSFSKKLQVLFGARLDFVQYETDRINAPLDFFFRSISSKATFWSKQYTQFSPMIGLVYEDSPDLRFYVNKAKSFARATRVVDNPEESNQFEFGFKYKTSNNRLHIAAAIYHLQRDNISIPLTTPLQGDVYVPAGSQQSEGFEFEFMARTTAFINFSLAYGYTLSELSRYAAITSSEHGNLILGDFSGNKAPFVPAHLTTLWINGEFGSGFGCGVGGRYAGNQYIDLDNTNEIKDYFAMAAYLAIAIKPITLRVNAENILATEYFTRGLSPYSVLPAGARVIYGTIDVTL